MFRLLGAGSQESCHFIRTGDVRHSPGHAAIVGCLDGLLEENNASVVLGLLGDESLGVEMAKSC